MNTQEIAVAIPQSLLTMIDDLTRHRKISRSKFIADAVREKILKEGAKRVIKEKDESETDPWDALDIEAIAVETGRPDGSVNHDRYIYGTPKIGK